MFKANVIKDKMFYQYQHFQLIGFMLTVIPLAIMSNVLFGMSEWVFVPSAIIYIVLLVMLFKNQKKILHSVSELTIEANHEQITIYSKKQGVILEFEVSEIDTIRVSKNNQIEPVVFSEIIDQFKGKFSKSFIQVETQKDTKRIEFLVESHYQLIQLEKCMDLWQEKNIEVTVL